MCGLSGAFVNPELTSLTTCRYKIGHFPPDDVQGHHVYVTVTPGPLPPHLRTKPRLRQSPPGGAITHILPFQLIAPACAHSHLFCLPPDAQTPVMPVGWLFSSLSQTWSVKTTETALI